MELISSALGLSLAFLLGSVPTAYLVGKKVRSLDIRQHGSGNVGATNAFRVLGKKWGTFVLITDSLKGWIAASWIAPASGAFPHLNPLLVQILFGAAAIAGHTWTPWLGFKGGKGIATSAGALLGALPDATLAALLIWGICFLTTGYVSLASILAAGIYPFLIILLYRKEEGFEGLLFIGFLLAGFLVYNHRSNIRRLLGGTESKVNLWKKNDA